MRGDERSVVQRIFTSTVSASLSMGDTRVGADGL